MNDKCSIAIIGAGITGSSLARLLTDTARAEVSLFDKSALVGGRMATRHTDLVTFDHGAPFFTARENSFKEFLTSYRSSFSIWDAKVTTLSPDGKMYKRQWFEPHYIGVPTMRSLCEAIVQGLDTRLGSEVTSVSGEIGAWFIDHKTGRCGPFDWVISTAPAEQTRTILNIPLPAVQYHPVFSLLIPLSGTTRFDVAIVLNSPLEILINGATKKARFRHPSLVAHAGSDWSTYYIDHPVGKIEAMLMGALAELGDFKPNLDNTTTHRWRYAKVSETSDNSFFLDKNQQIGACGDWTKGPGVEASFMSAHSLYLEITRHL